MSLGERLREERERHGFTQPALAAVVGVSKRSQQDWERGIAAPNANYLTAIAAEGLDVQYVLTGIAMRDAALREAWRRAAKVTVAMGSLPEAEAELIKSYYSQIAVDLTDAETELVGLYRQCSTAARTTLVEMAQTLARPGGAKAAAPAAGKPKVQQIFKAPIKGQVIGGDHSTNTFVAGKAKKLTLAKGKS